MEVVTVSMKKNVEIRCHDKPPFLVKKITHFVNETFGFFHAYPILDNIYNAHRDNCVFSKENALPHFWLQHL